MRDGHGLAWGRFGCRRRRWRRRRPTILANSDAVRNPERSFGLVVSLVSYKDGKQNEASSLAVYSRADQKAASSAACCASSAPAATPAS